jgi:hypothetical protein
MNLKLLPHWRVLWRSWSVRLNALGLAILAWFAFDPVSLLAVWNMMPAAVRDLIPEQFLSVIGAALFALSMIARLVKQPKMQEKIDAAK